MAGSASQRAEAAAPALSGEEFAKFCEFFYRRTGIAFEDKKKYFVDRRIHERIQKTRSASFREYFSIVRFQASGEELQNLVNLMTVNETYFLREDYQFDILCKGILPEIVRGRRPGSTVRIWSMPCSTGEEPYSIAIHMLENWSRADEFDIQITASDIDSRVLADARAGIYGERSLQRMSPELRSRYFSRVGPDQYQIRSEMRQSIDFSRVNVVDPAHTSRFRAIDIIFCRNMLIYFDDVSRRQTVDAFYECLVPGGFICLGHSESMSRISSLFVPRKFMNTIVYQKPLTAE
ncbi:MAG: protein-glutamate O-methyltransferase CheR [Xanthobacteraceae bacterium]